MNTKKLIFTIVGIIVIFLNLNCASISVTNDKYYLLQSNFNGHKLPLWSLRFDNSGEKLFAAGVDGKISIFDMKSPNTVGKIFSWQDRPEVDGSVGRGGAVLGIAVSPDGQYLYTAGIHSEKISSKRGRLKIIDLKNNGIVKRFLDDVSENILSLIERSETGKYLLGVTESGQCVLWKGAGENFTVAYLSNNPNSKIPPSFLGIRHDERYFFAFIAGYLFVWEIQQDLAVRLINKVQLQSQHLMDAYFSPDGKSIIAIDAQTSSSKIVKYSFEKIITSPTNGVIQANVMTNLPQLARMVRMHDRTEFLALTRTENSMQIIAIDTSTGRTRNVTPKDFSWDSSNNKKTTFFYGITSANGKLAFGDGAGNIYIADIDSQRIIGTYSSGLQLNEVATIKQDSLLVKGAAFNQKGGLQLKLSQLQIFGTNSEIDKLSSARGIFGELPKSCVAIDNKYGDLTLRNGHSLESFIRADGICLQNKDKKTWILIGSSDVCSIDFETGENKCTFAGIIGTESATLSSDGKFLALVNSPGGEITIVDSEKLKTTATFAFSKDKKNWLAYTPDSYVMGTSEGFSWYGWKEQSEKDETHIKFFGFDQFDLKFNRPDIVLQRFWGEGIPLTEDQKAQINKLHKFAEIRAKQNGFSLEKLEANKTIHAPELTFSETFDGKVLKDEKLNLKFSAVDNVASIIGYKIWINGVPIHGEYIRRNYPESTKLIEDNEVTISEAIQLSQGENKIEVSAFTEDGVESPRESFTVKYDPPTKYKPELYFVGIGIDSYNAATNGGLDALKYAVKDSKELEETFKKAGNNFTKVHTKVLANAEVTRESISKLKEFLSKSRVDDHVILFLSGHGIRKDTKVSDLITAFGANVPPQYKLRDKSDVDDVYYYMTPDSHVDKPWEKAVPLDAIREIVNGIPSRQKIMLVDTCQSGEKLDLDDATVASLTKNVEIRKTRGKTAQTRGVKLVTTGNSKEKPEEVEKKIVQTIAKTNALKEMSELFPELRRGTGTIEISAATGAQSALESNEWKNGAFTFVIKEAILKGKAKDAKGNITARSLRKFVLEEVEKLTDGQQTPMVARDIAGRDFVIFGK